MADQSTPNYRRSLTFARPAADSTRWANAPDPVSVISCTSNRFRESYAVNFTADDRVADHDREVHHAVSENAPDHRADRRDAATAAVQDRKRDARRESETDRKEASRGIRW